MIIITHFQARRQGVWLGVAKCLNCAASPEKMSLSRKGGGGGGEEEDSDTFFFRPDQKFVAKCS